MWNLAIQTFRDSDIPGIQEFRVEWLSLLRVLADRTAGDTVAGLESPGGFFTPTSTAGAGMT